MILDENQMVNVIVRAIIIEEGHLVVTQDIERDHFRILIGGRVDFGEPVVEALKREVWEETGRTVTSIDRLLYFSENVMAWPNGEHPSRHELGWYFLVGLDGEVCPQNIVRPNPDHHRMIVQRIPLTAVGLNGLWPPFLRQQLIQDIDNGFADCPRALFHRYDGFDLADEAQYTQWLMA